MKKAMLLALAALTVSVAQAVTWSTSDTGSASTTLSGVTSASAMLVFDVTSDMTTDTNLLTLSLGDGTNNYFNATIERLADGSAKLSMTWNNTSTTTGSWSNTSATGLANALSTEGEHTVAIEIHRTSNGSTTVEWIIDGNNLGTAGATFSTSGAVVQNYLSSATYTATATAAASVDGVVYVGETDDITIVPEPTALALLALGVAGIALRRRAA